MAIRTGWVIDEPNFKLTVDSDGYLVVTSDNPSISIVKGNKLYEITFDYDDTLSTYKVGIVNDYDKLENYIYQNVLYHKLITLTEFTSPTIQIKDSISIYDTIIGFLWFDIDNNGNLSSYGFTWNIEGHLPILSDGGSISPLIIDSDNIRIVSNGFVTDILTGIVGALPETIKSPLGSISVYKFSGDTLYLYGRESEPNNIYLYGSSIERKIGGAFINGNAGNALSTGLYKLLLDVPVSELPGLKIRLFQIGSYGNIYYEPNTGNWYVDDRLVVQSRKVDFTKPITLGVYQTKHIPSDFFNQNQLQYELVVIVNDIVIRTGLVGYGVTIPADIPRFVLYCLNSINHYFEGIDSTLTYHQKVGYYLDGYIATLYQNKELFIPTLPISSNRLVKLVYLAPIDMPSFTPQSYSEKDIRNIVLSFVAGTLAIAKGSDGNNYLILYDETNNKLFTDQYSGSDGTNQIIQNGELYEVYYDVDNDRLYVEDKGSTDESELHPAIKDSSYELWVDEDTLELIVVEKSS